MNNQPESLIIVSHERELREQWEFAHLRAHVEEHVARGLAVAEINRRLTEMNELRSQIDKERGEFLRRELYDREHNTLREALSARMDTVVDKFDARIKILESLKSNLEGRMWGISAAMGILVVLVNLAIRYWSK